MRIPFHIAALCACAVFPAAAEEPFQFKPGERVLFVGDALLERDIYHNYLETMLSVRLHGKGVTFRNAAWSGDTVWGESRAVFGSQRDGYNALIKIVNETRPGVVILAYGLNESFAGKDGLARFEQGYAALLENVLHPEKDAEFVAAPPAQAVDRRVPNDKATGNTLVTRPVPRVILLSPMPFQPAEAPPAARALKLNENLALYTQAIRGLAQKHGARFIDLFTAFSQPNPDPQQPLTDDGLHLTAHGYLKWALAIDANLAGSVFPWRGFAARVPGAYLPANYPSAPANGDATLVALQQTIRAKNLQFFNKWRPQNDTYLFLFRKHEQGRNAKEIPEFDPIIEAKEKDIAAMAEDAAKKLGL